MKLNQIENLSQQFLSLASKEETVPPNTKDVKELLSNLSQLLNFNSRIEYATNNLKRISSGSSRIVFQMPDDQVLKLASNQKGISQNQAEAKVKTSSPYVNKVITSCPNNYWVVAKKCNKITPKEFEEMTQIPFHLFGDALRAKIKNEPTSKVKNLMDHPLVSDLAEICKKYRLMLGDLVRISSYGELNDHPILIDLGLTQKIYQHFYSSNAKKKSKNPSS